MPCGARCREPGRAKPAQTPARPRHPLPSSLPPPPRVHPPRRRVPRARPAGRARRAVHAHAGASCGGGGDQPAGRGGAGRRTPPPPSHSASCCARRATPPHCARPPPLMAARGGRRPPPPQPEERPPALPLTARASGCARRAIQASPRCTRLGPSGASGRRPALSSAAGVRTLRSGAGRRAGRGARRAGCGAQWQGGVLGAGVQCCAVLGGPVGRLPVSIPH